MEPLLDNEEITVVAENSIERVEPLAEATTPAYRNFVWLPALFLTVALLGGLRIGLGTGEFLFVRPAL
ncbi:MAG: hypothetical protein OEM82_12455, partial [Acidobacteriota bacterium]|nr:hypothetical protein [Acidobacteriota bacterium]